MKALGKVLDTRAYAGSVAPPASLKDWSRYGNDGTFNGNVAWEQLPSSLWVLGSYDGTTDYVEIAHSDEFNLPVSFTCECWFNTNTVISQHMVIAKDNSFWTGINGTGLRFTTDAIRDYDTTVVTLVVDTWYYYVVVFDSSFDANFYLNGVFQETIAGAAAVPLDVDNVYIGAENATDQEWNGELGLPNMYNFELSSDQIYRRFQSTRGYFNI